MDLEQLRKEWIHFFFTLSYEIKNLHPENQQLLSPMVSGAYTKCTFSALKKQSCLQKSLLYMLEKQNNGGLKYLVENLFWENERLNTSMYSKAKKKNQSKWVIVVR